LSSKALAEEEAKVDALRIPNSVPLRLCGEFPALIIRLRGPPPYLYCPFPFRIPSTYFIMMAIILELIARKHRKTKIFAVISKAFIFTFLPLVGALNAADMDSAG